ncbi:MAG: class I SAM-dependent methyltransferase [Chloroflexota bacterium]
MSDKTAPQWDEQDSQAFIDFGRYFVPHREQQIATICDLIAPPDHAFTVIELCCGEGLLAGALLDRYPLCSVHAFDGSPEMLQRAQTNLAHYGTRFTTTQFDLMDSDRRNLDRSVHAIVSSLAIHHLDDKQKQLLYKDIFALLEPNGALMIADVVQPADRYGEALAAQAWDDAVKQKALVLDGHTKAFEFFQNDQWNMYLYPDPMDKPSRLFDQLKWLAQAGFADVDVYWMQAGHAIFGGRRAAI